MKFIKNFFKMVFGIVLTAVVLVSLVAVSMFLNKVTDKNPNLSRDIDELVMEDTLKVIKNDWNLEVEDEVEYSMNLAKKEIIINGEVFRLVFKDVYDVGVSGKVIYYDNDIKKTLDFLMKSKNLKFNKFIKDNEDFLTLSIPYKITDGKVDFGRFNDETNYLILSYILRIYYAYDYCKNADVEFTSDVFNYQHYYFIDRVKIKGLSDSHFAVYEFNDELFKGEYKTGVFFTENYKDFLSNDKIEIEYKHTDTEFKLD